MKYYDQIPSDVYFEDVAHLIPHGKDKAICSNTLARKLGVSDSKTEVRVRKCILEAIESGYLIGSCSRGYFIISTVDEYNDYIDSLEGRKIGIQNRINNLRENWNAKQGQTRLSL